uniref:Uncharacterized protein n=1 Tax=Aegilops tauschii TaxID=37682 RepID=M8CLB1_AEGTA
MAAAPGVRCLSLSMPAAAGARFGRIGLRGDCALVLMQFRSDQHKWQQAVVEKA